MADNTGNPEPAVITVFYLGNHQVLDLEIITIPGVDGFGGTFRIPKGTRRIIIEMDSTPIPCSFPCLEDSGVVPLTVSQVAGPTFQNPGLLGARMEINVE